MKRIAGIVVVLALASAGVAGDDDVPQGLADAVARMKHSDPLQRVDAINNLRLWRKGGARILVPALLVALTDRHVDVRIAASEALYERLVMDRSPVVARLVPSLAELTRCLDDADPRVRLQLVLVFAQLELEREAGAAVPALVARLRDPAAPVRAAAARLLGKREAPAAQAAQALVELLRDPDHSVRCAALGALPAAIGHATVPVPTVIEALTDEDPEMRAAAARVLGNLGAEASSAVPALRRALTDSEPGVRASAALALGGIGKPAASATAELASMLDPPDELLARSAATALGRIGPDAAAAADALAMLVVKGFEVSEDLGAIAGVALFRMGDPALTALGRACSRLDADARVRILDALPQCELDSHGRFVWHPSMPESATLPGLLAWLRDPDARVRAAAARTCAGHAAAIAALAGAAREDPDAGVRQASTRALASMGDGAVTVLDLLVRALDEGDVRHHVVAGLASLGARSAPAIPRLRAFVADAKEEGWFRSVAAEALGRIGTPEAIAQLAELMGRTDRRTSMACARVLGGVGASALPVLEGILRTADPERRSLAAYALGTAGRAAAPSLPALIAATGDEVADVRSSALDALEGAGAGSSDAVRAALSAAARSDAPTREAAIRALGRLDLGTPEVLDALAKALRDASPEVRCAAGAALVRLRAANAIEALVASLEDPDASVRRAAAFEIAKLGPRATGAVAALERALERERDANTARGLSRALAAIRDGAPRD